MSSPLPPPTPVSPVFLYNAKLRPEPVDLSLLSSDATLFFVHVAVILSKSSNNFGGLLPPDCLHLYSTGVQVPIAVGNTAAVLNLVLHVIYDITPLPQNLDLQELAAIVDALAFYGVSLHAHIHSGTPLFQLFAAHAPTAPIEVYALAASHDLHDLAVLSSAYSLGIRMCDISADQVVRMGAIYLRRLIDLQLNRTEKLKELLRPLPVGHAPTESCSAADQARLTNAWLTVGASFLWGGAPELTTHTLETSLGRLEQDIYCSVCRAAFRKRLAYVLRGWDMVQRTI